ncbi:MAG: ABC transporter permease [Verrucomicrobia bacterium]|nr:ABC transporter permease [Verrucomicrobiota bacterium]
MLPKRVIILLAELRESFHMAISAVAAHKLRSALTLLGVLVGVFSIIVVMTAMRVMQSYVESELSQLGDQTFMVRKFPTILFNRPEGLEKLRQRKNITLQEGRRLQAGVTLARAVGVESYFWAGQIQTQYKRSSPDVRLYGETPGSFPARNWIVQDGRGIADADVEGAHDVCVLGNSLAKTIFPTSPAVGERVKIDGLNYTVVGVLQAKGGSLGGDQDKFAVIPITTGLNRFGYLWRSLTILVQARDRASVDACVEEVRGLLRIIRKVPPGEPDSFDVASNDTLISQFNAFTFTVRIGMAIVSSIALLAAGIGIMNIMLVSVTERTREIGIRRAIGAKKRNIMGNATAFFFKLEPVIPFDWAIIGLFICSVVGVVFGTYPAFKAANLDPIESLRYE